MKYYFNKKRFVVGPEKIGLEARKLLSAFGIELTTISNPEEGAAMATPMATKKLRLAERNIVP